jgi:hypothetical protein
LLALHCDYDQCDSWQREPSQSFLVLTGQDSKDNHFCSVDCIMHWAAQFGPKDVIA